MNTTSREQHEEVYVITGTDLRSLERTAGGHLTGADGEGKYSEGFAKGFNAAVKLVIQKAALSVDKDGEAVAWQYREYFTDIEPGLSDYWKDCTFGEYLIYKDRIGSGRSRYEVRELFTHPSPPNQQVRDAYEKAAQRIRWKAMLDAAPEQVNTTPVGEAVLSEKALADLATIDRLSTNPRILSANMYGKWFIKHRAEIFANQKAELKE